LKLFKRTQYTKNSLDTVDNGTNRHTEGTAGTILGDLSQMRLWVETDGLVTRVVARHVAFAAVNAHLLHWGDAGIGLFGNWLSELLDTRPDILFHVVRWYTTIICKTSCFYLYC